jgi:hypothetical protein
MRRLASDVIRELEARIARLEHEAGAIKPGDYIMLKKDALQLHSRKTPASSGYSKFQMEYRNALSKLQGQELRVKFVQSNGYVVESPVGSIDVPKYMAEKVENLRMAAGDSVMAREFVLNLVNDGNIYRMVQANIKNLARKMVKGQYQEALALKAMMNIITAYLPTYKKENKMPSYKMDKATKDLAAEEMLEYYQDELDETAEDMM